MILNEGGNSLVHYGYIVILVFKKFIDSCPAISWDRNITTSLRKIGKWYGFMFHGRLHGRRAWHKIFPMFVIANTMQALELYGKYDDSNSFRKEGSKLDVNSGSSSWMDKEASPQ